MDRSTSKLTDLAKRVAVPRDIVGTDWGPVAGTCRNELGIDFDGWQDGMGQLMLSKGPSGRLSHTVGGFHLSAMRQVGKTYFFAGSLFGMCQHYPGLLVIWSAHHSKTHNETFQSMQAFAQRRQIAPVIEKVFTGSGDEEVRFWNGSRILFGARERGFGRGIPGVDVLVSDEGQILSEKAMQAMLATLNTSWLGLHIYAGTPPGPEEVAAGKSEQWMRMHDEAWLIDDQRIVRTETDDMVWVEFGADDDGDIDDIEQWAKNPSWPHRTPTESIMRLRRKLNDAGFSREGLGRYDKDKGSIFDMTKWNTLSVDDAEEPTRAALVVDVSPDRRWSTIGIAAEYDDDRALVMVKPMRGTDGVAKVVLELDTDNDLIAIKITPGAARAIETDLVKLGVDYETMSMSDVGAAYGNLQEKIKSGGLAHLDQPELNNGLMNTKSRYLNTGESESFDRRGGGPDTSPAVAAAGALYLWGINDQAMPYIG